MLIGDRVRFIRKNHKLKQKDFAEILGISQTHVSKIENGADVPSDRLINLISATFDINKEWLETGNGNITSDINIDKEMQQLKFQLRMLLDSKEKNSEDVIKIMCEVLAFCNMADFFSKKGIISCSDLLSPIIKAMYQFTEYIKNEYLAMDSREEISNLQEYIEKCEEVDEIKQAYTNNISSYFDTIISRIMTSSSSADCLIEHYDKFGKI